MEWMSENYNLTVSDNAWDDINSYIDYIIYTCYAPKTGKKHYDELMSLLEKIEKNPTLYSTRMTTSLLQYGYNVRRANYKKMAIIYTINGSTVYVHRVVAASMITDL
jgi:hypothetical protein